VSQAVSGHETHHRLPARSVLHAATLVALMAFGSVLLWLGAPIGWLWLGSQFQHGSEPSIGPYVVIAVGLPTTMYFIAKWLGILDRAYGRTVGFDEEHSARVPLPWLKSMRGERDPGRRRSVLDIVMIISVAAAFILMAVWFFFFAGSSLPTG
jgi:hypothetical protein